MSTYTIFAKVCPCDSFHEIVMSQNGMGACPLISIQQIENKFGHLIRLLFKNNQLVIHYDLNGQISGNDSVNCVKDRYW